MLLPRELDMIAAGKHMPLPAPKPKLSELVEVNKQEQRKIDSADEDWHGQVWTRRPAPRDCATGSGMDCSHKSVPVAVTSKQVPTIGRGPAGSNQERQRQQQLGPQAPPGMQGRGSDQQRVTSQPGPQQKQPAQTTERRLPQQKQPSPATESRGG
jgi:hypothetical protein